MSAAGQCRILPCFSCIRASLWSVVMIFVFGPVFFISRLNWVEARRKRLTKPRLLLTMDTGARSLGPLRRPCTACPCQSRGSPGLRMCVRGEKDSESQRDVPAWRRETHMCEHLHHADTFSHARMAAGRTRRTATCAAYLHRPTCPGTRRPRPKRATFGTASAGLHTAGTAPFLAVTRDRA